MTRTNNYSLQAQQAKQCFLRYDQKKLIEKLRVKADETYIYVNLLCRLYRISRKTGDLEFWDGDVWQDGNTFEEVMTLLDLVCDSREDRYLSCRWKNMQAFGLMFHKNLLEDGKDPWAQRFQRDPQALRRACIALKGEPLSHGDVAYAIELFDGLCIGLQFWEGDEEFAPRIRYLWDENALMYIKYETMYFAVNLLLRRIMEEMEHLPT